MLRQLGQPRRQCACAAVIYPIERRRRSEKIPLIRLRHVRSSSSERTLYTEDAVARKESEQRECDSGNKKRITRSKSSASPGGPYPNGDLRPARAFDAGGDRTVVLSRS